MFSLPKTLCLIAAVMSLPTTPPIHGQSSAATRTPALTFPGASVELAMPNTRGRSLVEAFLGEDGGYAFFIDTGADVTVVDAAIARQLGLEVVGSELVGAPGGDPVEADRVVLPTIRVGGLEISGVTAITLDLVGMTGGIMEGILGMDLFQEFLLTLDPSAGRAVITRGELPTNGPGIVITAPTGRMTFPITVAGQAIEAHIDHGSPSGFTLGIEHLESVPTLDGATAETSAGLVGGQRSVRTGTLDGSIELAGITFANPRVGFMNPSPGSANIGSVILDAMVTTLDFRNRRISFVPAAGATRTVAQPGGQGPTRRVIAPQAGARRVLGIQFGGPGAGLETIAGVVAGSVAEAAGFRAGDHIVTLNGQPMTAFQTTSLGALIGGSEPLVFELLRNGESLTIRVGS